MPHILIIEDDTDINNAVTEYIAARGCRCTQAFSGTEGRLYWQQGGVDLIIADLMLPGLTGQQLLAEIRAKSSVPVIVLSARTALQDKVELLELGGRRLPHQALFLAGTVAAGGGTAAPCGSSAPIFRIGI